MVLRYDLKKGFLKCFSPRKTRKKVNKQRSAVMDSILNVMNCDIVNVC